MKLFGVVFLSVISWFVFAKKLQDRVFSGSLSQMEMVVYLASAAIVLLVIIGILSWLGKHANDHLLDTNRRGVFPVGATRAMAFMFGGLSIVDKNSSADVNNDIDSYGDGGSD